MNLHNSECTKCIAQSFTALLLLLGSCNSRESVTINLRHGTVLGYSQYVVFPVSPQPSTSGLCDVQAVVKVDFTGPFNAVKINLEYERPRLWTLDISDSPTGDGYGGDNGSTSNYAETHIFNKQMRIYANDLPGFTDATISGGHLIKVIDDVVSSNDKLTVEISDERIDWVNGKNKQFIESKFLYTLNGQNVTWGKPDYDIYVGLNRVILGNYRYGSGLCRATISLIEGDVDECKYDKHDCHVDAVCVNTRRSYRCRCKSGFYGNGKQCSDIDECEYENGGCVHFCQNHHGSYSCSCRHGFELAPDRKNCIDENECFTDKGGCEHQCLNTLGKYECQCNAGYALNPDGRTCIAGSWCKEQLGCSHHCLTTRVGMECGCREGYNALQDGKVCLATCSVGNGGCQHICTDTADGPLCSCHDKYFLQPDGMCVATCRVNNGGCDRKCKDTPVGPKCICPEGYELHADGKTCLDIDECRSPDRGGCSHGCLNVQGSYQCVCPKGFKVQFDQKTCKDVDECEINSTCDHTCINTAGSYQCLCKEGFDKYATIHCADRNECSDRNGGCSHGCNNTIGSYQCTCPKDLVLHVNGKDCIERGTGSCYPLIPPNNGKVDCVQDRNTTSSCTVHCGNYNSVHLLSGGRGFTTRCGEQMQFQWSHLKNADKGIVPICSEAHSSPSLRRRVRFDVHKAQCYSRKRIVQDLEASLADLFTRVLDGKTKTKCPDLCHLENVAILCRTPRGIRRRPTRRTRLVRRRDVNTMTVQFELKLEPQAKTGKCGSRCTSDLTEKRMKRALKIIRKTIDNGELELRLDEQVYKAASKTMKASMLPPECASGNVPMTDKIHEDTCVACGVGSHFDDSSKTCQLCRPGTYQDMEGQLSCKVCSHNIQGVGLLAATNTSQCHALCEPGSYSPSGLKPCRQCQSGYYQPDHGSSRCISCGQGVTTRRSGATGFHDCNVKETCSAGEFFNKETNACEACPLNTYQAEAGQDFCVQCPGNTTTDETGAYSSTLCKSRTCGGHIGELQGFIETPNWPGDYPFDVECTWDIVPQKGRRILVVIPEIQLPSEERCEDRLVMRKTASPYSQATYETCESSETPIAFTSRSKRLWIQFRSNKKYNAKGFSIPYVTYNEEYQNLIEDIVRDGRLYSSHLHQAVLKDRVLLSALLEVIAQPYNYFKYAKTSKSMFPDSFIKLLTPKVRRFFT